MLLWQFYRWQSAAIQRVYRARGALEFSSDEMTTARLLCARMPADGAFTAATGSHIPVLDAVKQKAPAESGWGSLNGNPNWKRWGMPNMSNRQATGRIPAGS